MQDAARQDVRCFDVKNPGIEIEISDGNSTLWRYMDLAKLLALVSKRSLFFPALDNLGDRFEGRWSNRTLELIQDSDELWTRDTGNHVVVEDKRRGQHLAFQKLVPSWSVGETIGHWNGEVRGGAASGSTFVNCWYEDVEESKAMWKLFAGQQYGVAVRTTAARLVGSFTERLPDYFGRVSYIAYDSDLMPITECPPVFFKRRAFMHEREVRAVVAPAHRVELAQQANPTLGIERHVDPAWLIQAVVISPYSPGWLPDIVRSILEKYEIDAAVEKSVLEKPPPGEGSYLTVRSPKAYFAFWNGQLPLRVWATSRANALEAAREYRQLDPADEHLEIWTEAECDAGHHERPNECERIASQHSDEFQNSLDPERN